MSEAKDTKDTKKEQPRARQESIPVAQIRFTGPTDLPGKSVCDGLGATPREQVVDGKGERINRVNAWLIEYLPWMRHHLVTFFPVDRSRPPESCYVHESNVRTWKPAL